MLKYLMGWLLLQLNLTLFKQEYLLTLRDVEIEDDSFSSEQIEDIWVFERDIKSKDPNWKLVETGTTEID